MVKLSDLPISERKLLKSTKTARIYNVQDKYAVKSLATDYVVPPHNPRYELAIMKKILRLGDFRNAHLIELLDHSKRQDELELLLLFYPSTLDEFMIKNYKPSYGNDLKPTRRKFNPYYSLTKSPMEEQEIEPYNMVYENYFDINQYSYGFFLQLVEGLTYLHSHGIIHRDIKPQNILLEMNGEDNIQLIITDFGISYDETDSKQVVTERPDDKITDVSTSFYKAPELLFGVKNYRFEVDIWALLVLVSQWFQVSTNIENFAPAMFDDGSNVLESGSDIRLIMSIFEKLGIPSIEKWEDVSRYGSRDAFTGMFGEEGDGNYILDQSEDIQRSIVLEKLMPRLKQLIDRDQREKFVTCIMNIVSFASEKRWSSQRILAELRS
ncbi:cyclin-dependent protein kinase-activating kinase CAK1 NDAI_0G03150 [Naumovozyma dairenensis CBS 421]|uniref:Protein kinase domain-containing protein n=1 Tax=Naumovozyma dairenensis (strain ATCC 10597 / BCRC 20456 / CBS 421 / NBRC 0211 / NRRL Y-12639) TaxID=1071378 RepID=G0WE81_NAUDC|nr:hypothetical protein NDAI_0G03150 [Naumovozyma dairenensis CBS 421]CCD26092.2 hypothetical protein NDAI_0G03150 [Naumovozyma dairenensis CBS 421]